MHKASDASTRGRNRRDEKRDERETGTNRRPQDAPREDNRDEERSLQDWPIAGGVYD